MVPPLPNEIVETILENLSLDKPTLLSCALVGRAWVSASQRGIFRLVTLQFPSYPDFDPAIELVDAYLKANARLSALFNSNPRLASYVRTLELRNPNIDHPRAEVFYTSTAGLIRSLSNVNDLSLVEIYWDSLSPLLKEALFGIFTAPSLTRITFNTFQIWSFAEFAALLGHATNLKVLKDLRGVSCIDWTSPKTSPTTLLRLDKLRLGSLNYPLSKWIQENVAPKLRSLDVTFWLASDFHGIDLVLQHFSRDLEELKIRGIHLARFSHVPIPNLRTLKVDLSVSQTDTKTPVPYIQSLFGHLLHRDGINRCPQLRRLKLRLDIKHDNPLETPQWDHWASFNTQIEKLHLASLKVYITVTSHRKIPNGVIERLETKLPFLKKLGNLLIYMR